ncbi:YihY/virulence factor BrkB family protein [Catellatospora sichuanensis]|uniref:YihY/virulence factor BrkB family protein n=1 Tax=Catellatospora sichuanensis TaxID=1969805 RepID=UPI001642C66A|nr:YihY/virulence factor BrkB family protein [Catellatospora sichuanensis]
MFLRPKNGEGTPPEGPAELSRRDWKNVLKRTAKEYQSDNLSDWAAALTYRSVMSLFPAILVLVALLGLTGEDTAQRAVDQVGRYAPGAVRQVVENALAELQRGRSGTAGLVALLGVLLALWSASGYVSAFTRAANVIYDVPEGRSFLKLLPVRLGVTVVASLAITTVALALVFTGPVARQAGEFLHLGTGFVQVWDIVKWPLVLGVIALIFALLYWASPNARQSGWRWITPGSVLAVLIWLIASAGFALYAANFGSYNKIYGSLAGVIVFLIWLWIGNIALLLGAELDAELHRERAITTGHPAGEEPYLELREQPKDPDHDDPGRR